MIRYLVSPDSNRSDPSGTFDKIKIQVNQFLADHLNTDTMYLAMPKWKASQLIDAIQDLDLGQVFELTTIKIKGQTNARD